MFSFFQNFNRDIIMTEKNEKDYRINNICRFFEKNIEPDKDGDHCYFTGKYRGPAQNQCDIVTTQKQSFFHLFFTILLNMIVICFSKC